MSEAEVLAGGRLEQEFKHLRADWWWFLVLGLLLVICGTVAIVFPILATAISIKVLGIVLMVAGASTIIAAFWTAKWSGFLVDLLIGILYLVVGFAITDRPFVTPGLTLTLFLSAWFIVAGGYRAIAALVVRFPFWGWALLNGIITFLLGIIIYREFPESGLWVIGLLVGIELLFHGWMWIMLALGVHRIPKATA